MRKELLLKIKYLDTVKALDPEEWEEVEVCNY